MDLKTSLTNWALLMSLVFLWGTSFMFISVSVETVDPLSIVFFRVVLGALVLTLVLYAKGLRLPFSIRAWLAFFLMGFVGNILPFFLIAWGQQSVNSGVAGMHHDQPLPSCGTGATSLSEAYKSEPNGSRLANFADGILRNKSQQVPARLHTAIADTDFRYIKEVIDIEGRRTLDAGR